MHKKPGWIRQKKQITFGGPDPLTDFFISDIWQGGIQGWDETPLGEPFAMHKPHVWVLHMFSLRGS